MRLQIPPLGDRAADAASPETRVDQPERGVAGAIGDERDRAAVRRPARIGVVVVAVGERKRIAAVDRQQPQLLPLPPEITAVDDARAVGRDVGPARATTSPRAAGARGVSAPSTGSRTMSPVPCAISRFDTNTQLLAVARPCRVDRVIERAVVVARDAAAPIRQSAAATRDAARRGPRQRAAGSGPAARSRRTRAGAHPATIAARR